MAVRHMLLQPSPGPQQIYGLQDHGIRHSRTDHHGKEPEFHCQYPDQGRSDYQQAADEAIRIQRIMEQDGVSQQQVRERMENQWLQV